MSKVQPFTQSPIHWLGHTLCNTNPSPQTSQSSKTWKGSLSKSTGPAKLRMELSQFNMSKERAEVILVHRDSQRPEMCRLSVKPKMLNPCLAEGLDPAEVTQKFLPIPRAQAALPWLLPAVTCSPFWGLYVTFGQKSCRHLLAAIWAAWKHHVSCPARSSSPIKMGWRSSRGLRSARSSSSGPPLQGFPYWLHIGAENVSETKVPERFI